MILKRGERSEGLQSPSPSSRLEVVDVGSERAPRYYRARCVLRSTQSLLPHWLLLLCLQDAVATVPGWCRTSGRRHAASLLRGTLRSVGTPLKQGSKAGHVKDNGQYRDEILLLK